MEFQDVSVDEEGHDKLRPPGGVFVSPNPNVAGWLNIAVALWTRDSSWFAGTFEYFIWRSRKVEFRKEGWWEVERGWESD